MNLHVIGFIGIIVMLGLMFLRMPIGLSMIVVGFAGFSYVAGWDQGLSTLSLTAYRTASTYIMTSLPLFMFMGVVAGTSRLSKDAFNATHRWVGHLPGGLAMATVGAAAFFGAVCGAASATSAMVCTIALPEMRRYHYSDQLSLGTIASSGGLGFIIPPSSAFIIYAFLTDESIGSLFMAGILPGLLISILFMIIIYYVCRHNPGLAETAPRESWKDRFKALWGIWAILFLFILVLGGIYTGVFTSTESGAVGAFGAILLGFVKKQLNWQKLKGALIETGMLTGMIILLFIGSMVFNYFMAITEIPFMLSELVISLSLPPAGAVILILLVYIVLGFIMDIIPLMVLVVPITAPTLAAMNVDPVWFGVLIVVSAMIGLITPPVGMNVYVTSGMVRDVPIFTIFRGVWPFFFALLVALVILMVFPQISLFLPNMMSQG